MLDKATQVVTYKAKRFHRSVNLHESVPTDKCSHRQTDSGTYFHIFVSYKQAEAIVHRSVHIEREQTSTVRALHALDYWAWV